MNWEPEYDYGFIDPIFYPNPEVLGSYDDLNNSRKNIKSETLRYYYNKFNIKKEFINSGFKVPELYHHSNKQENIIETLRKYDSFVVKPCHMSESDLVIVKNPKSIVDYEMINEKIYGSLITEARKNEPDMLRYCDKGFIIEEYIPVLYELKVFVVWGCPILGDLRSGASEFYRFDFIGKNNPYFDWSEEYDLIKEFSKKIKLDFYRIDFLINESGIYASECAFMPSTDLPDDIKTYLSDKWSKIYYKLYYPQLF
jgi:hypothetical protein